MNLADDRIVSTAELLQIVPLSRSTIWRLEKAGQFPRRLKLGMRRVGWRLSDILEWIARHAEEASCNE